MFNSGCKSELPKNWLKMASAKVAQPPEEPERVSYTLAMLREATTTGEKPSSQNPFLFKKFAMHLRKDVLLKSKRVCSKSIYTWT